MSKKVIAIIMIIAIFLFSIFTGAYIFKILNKEKSKEIKLDEIYSREVSKDNNEVYLKDKTITTNSAEEKITPNTKLVIRKYYEECGHSINEYSQMPPELINLTKEELKQENKDWNIYSFSEEEVVLIKNIQDYCDQHYILKELDGYVAIYKVHKDGKQSLVEQTSISTRYLTQTDLSHLRSEIKVYGLENLNSSLEDFE